MVLTSIGKWQPADANVVVEIKHWKSKEKKFSVLAWSFLPAHVLIARSDAGGNGELCVHTDARLPPRMHLQPPIPDELMVSS
jgi:Cytoskeletal adhesion